MNFLLLTILDSLAIYFFVVLGLGSLFGIHWILFGLTIYICEFKKVQMNRVLFATSRILYGLVNPVIYLTGLCSIVLGPTYLAKWPILIGWASLGVYWALFLVRKFVRNFSAENGWGDRLARWLNWGLIVEIAFVFVWDICDIFSNKQIMTEKAAESQSNFWLILMMIPQYAIPAYILLRDRAKDVTSNARFMISGRKALVIIIVIAGFMLASLIPYPMAKITLRLDKHQTTLRKAQTRYQIDATLLKAVILTANSEHSTLVKGSLKNLLSSVWLFDSTNNFKLTKKYDISFGLAQIKPSTLMEFFYLREINQFPQKSAYETRIPYKQLRDVLSWPIDDYKIKGFASNYPLPIEHANPINRQDIYELLSKDDGSILACAFILRSYIAQWAAAGIDISNRPDILGTLYNLGLRSSKPNKNPRPNNFGIKVLAQYRTLQGSL